MERLIIIIYKVGGNDEIIKDRIRLLGEWLNYFQGNWMVYTTFSVKEVYEMLCDDMPLNAQDKLLIMDVDLNNYYGALPPEAWQWLRGKREAQKH